jgi:hypothetical protein
MTAGYKWKPLWRTTGVTSETVLAATMEHYGISRDDAVAMHAKSNEGTELWTNDLYQVEVRRNAQEQSVHLNIRRRDGYPGRDWRHFQQIKNELVGPECEAVELYPAESRLTDTCNKYHLYCCSDPTFRFPFGFETRDVVDEQRDDHPGLRQRPPMKHARAK